MKKKRITALLLALFMVTNETAYPFGAENTVVEENTEEISRQEDADDSEEQGQTEVFSDSANVEEDSDFVINADGNITFRLMELLSN